MYSNQRLLTEKKKANVSITVIFVRAYNKTLHVIFSLHVVYVNCFSHTNNNPGTIFSSSVVNDLLRLNTESSHTAIGHMWIPSYYVDLVEKLDPQWSISGK